MYFRFLSPFAPSRRRYRRLRVANEEFCSKSVRLWASIFGHIRVAAMICDNPFLKVKEKIMYVLQPAKEEHFACIMDILNGGREFQRAQGFVQWPDGYPPASLILEDIEEGLGYVLLEGDAVAAYLYLSFAGDPAYPQIKGKWHYDEPYAVIHRMATAAAFRGKGAADAVFCLVEKIVSKRGIRTLRIDTDGKNKRMQHVLEKNGFSYCGTVVQGGGDRMAYDKYVGDVATE